MLNLSYKYHEKNKNLSTIIYHLPSTNRAFTIVELLVVVIAILSAITIVSFTGVSQKAIAVSLQSDLSNASKQLKLYYVDHGSYPNSLDVDNCPVSGGIIDNKYCLKASPNSSFTYPFLSGNSQTFSLKISKSGVSYVITQSTGTELAPVFIATATGGRVKTTDGSYTVITYTSSGTLVTSNDTMDAQMLVVGGWWRSKISRYGW